MSNLLSKAILEIAALDAEVYVVYQNSDWRLSLGNLIKLVTKATVGLERVDNTSDAEKPVSQAQAEALLLKADKSAVPTLEAFELLASQLQHYVTVDMLNVAIQGVTDAMQPFLNQQQVTVLVNQALVPVMDSLQAFNLEMSGINDRLTALENQNLDDVNAAAVNQIVMDALAPVKLNITQLEETTTSLSETMLALQQTLSNHRHAVDDIDGLDAFVEGKITVASGTNEW